MVALLNKTAFQLAMLAIVVFVCAWVIFLQPRPFDTIEGVMPTTLIDYAPALSSQNPSSWRSVTLPHDWSLDTDTATQRSYRIQFDASLDPEERLAIYIPMLAQHASFYLNNKWLAQTGELRPRSERHHNTPFFLEIPSALLINNKNELILELSSDVINQGILSPVYIGTSAQLEGAFALKKFVRIDWVQWLSFTMYLISAILALVWFNRRKDIVYGIFALELFIWATHNLNLFVQRIPVSPRLWEAMTMATLGWTVVLILFFNFRFLERPSPKMERVMLIYSAAGLLFFILPSTEWILLLGYTVWDAFLIVFGSYAMIYLTKAFRSTQQFDAWLMMLVGVPILMAGLHDILLVNSMWVRTDGLYIQYSVIPTGLLFGWFLFRRFVQSLTLAEQHAELLVYKVAEKEIQLTEQFQHIKSIELENLLSQERERMMRDMHDGIGGQLLAVQSQLNQKTEPWVSPLKEQIKATLVDFRLVIDSLDPLVNDIPMLLGQMRTRVQSLLDTHGIQLIWDINELPEHSALGPEQVLQIMRIIQEATANAIKHAQTKQVRISTGVVDGKICIDIEDAGVGLNTDSPKDSPTTSGRGIENMQYRANAINAEITLSELKPGTRVRLCLPSNL